MIRAKSNLHYQVVSTQASQQAAGVVSDQHIVMTGRYTRVDYPGQLRRIEFCDPQGGRMLVFLTNNFELQALQIAQLYKSRWQVELFFKWIKQHLRIKSFVGTSANAVKIQIWTAISTYVLVAIIKKRLNVSASLHAMLQVLSLNLFEKTPLADLLGDAAGAEQTDAEPAQLTLI